MITLRELRDDPNRRFDEDLCAQILMAVLRSEVVPLSPDDVIADPDEDVFEVRRSGSGDFSFASPQVLMGGREPAGEDRQYALGMVIHYLWGDPYEDLAIAAKKPLVRLYAANDERKSPLLLDVNIDKKLGDSNDLLKYAIVLTGGDADERAAADAEIEKWILGIDSQVILILMENGVNVGQYEHRFQKYTPKKLRISAGNVLNQAGVKYRFLQNRIIEFMPGRHMVETAVERMR